MARTKGRKRKWSVVHPRAAGIDIGSRFHVVAVSEDLDAKPVRTFSTFTNDLHRLAEWLKGLGVATVAMESTGVYWIPAFEILQARGVEVVLVNARNAKTVPGRKTDVNDAQWLQQLHQYGLLRGSFHPSRGVAALRAYLRHRERLLDYAAAHVQHLHKALTQMNVQLHRVVSDVTGATGLRIIRAIVSGNTDPEELARFRDVRCKASPETIREALFALLGVDLTQIHGLGPYVALKLVSECGTDMTKWPSSKHFTSWLCLAPGNKISGARCSPRALDDPQIERPHCCAWRPPPWGARTRRSGRFTVALQRGSARPRRSRRLLGNWRCCSTTPCAMAWSTPIRGPRTMRNGIANASLPTCAGVRSRWGLLSRRWRPREFLRKLPGCWD